MGSNEDVAADFYDIDSLLSRTTKVACTYSSSTPREVYELLGTNAPHYTDEKGYKVLTPFWFTRALKPFCSFTLPMAYNTNVQSILLANAAHADLEALQPYYYEMGMHFCHSVSEGVSLALAECLLKAFVQRIGGIVLRMYRENEAPKKIDNLEKKLYEESVKCRDRLHDYLRAHQTNRTRKRRLERLL
ncbi:partner of SLD five, PSF3 [Teladorsagia circumcincta]|uniref:DNA replication complex GINS protein PSF3 n=1 Tax=Teladorsagia circumcincta TaxID=45464 RepID=A0A2G9TRL1_TELCI|nr:partner of SLD five, PSF3 [Teladorsagia circumcincta]